MKQSLTLKLGQSLTMTPQLQQAIRLLQLSTLDLQLEIQQAIDTNPMLELEEDDFDTEADEVEDELPEIDVDDEDLTATADTETPAQPSDDEPTAADDWNDEIPEDLPVDSSWDDIYQPATTSAPAGDDFDIDSRNTTEESLQEHLRWQLNLTPMSDTDRMIATAIIDAVDPDGMLTSPIDDLLASFDPEFEIEEDEVVAVLKRIQQFDPPGIAARNLGECLVIQLHQLPDDIPWIAEAIVLAGSHLDLLAARDFPRPGAVVNEATPEYITPDVFVKKEKGRWRVELNADAAPRLRINSTYAGLVRRADSSADNTFLKDNLQEARWFLKSLASRNETLLKVATKIVEYQRGFLEYGDEAMKPLVLHDIAEAVEMHESTISRVTTRKYMHTPRGIFELKYFFSSHLATNTGGEVSSTAIRALIKKLTAEENPRKPLSDSKIAAILGEQNIKVARRTVAKYRELLLIPPSNERKRLV
jgi:RNA polymerase sigma-54 factor